MSQSFSSQIVREISGYWNDAIVEPLITIKDPTEFNDAIREINNSLYTELHSKMEQHMFKVFKRGLVEGSSRKIPETEIFLEFQKLISNANIKSGILRLSERLYGKLSQLPALRQMIITNKIPFKEVVTNIANAELSKFQTLARTETQFFRNNARMTEWDKRDPEGKYVYTWGRGHDSRVTECCIEIDATVTAEAKAANKRGVPMKRLLEIVAFSGGKWFPDFIQRPLNPHYNCRSGPRRAV
jgi:hypothetical protein